MSIQDNSLADDSNILNYVKKEPESISLVKQNKE